MIKSRSVTNFIDLCDDCTHYREWHKHLTRSTHCSVTDCECKAFVNADDDRAVKLHLILGLIGVGLIVAAIILIAKGATSWN